MSGTELLLFALIAGFLEEIAAEFRAMLDAVLEEE